MKEKKSEVAELEAKIDALNQDVSKGKRPRMATVVDKK